MLAAGLAHLTPHLPCARESGAPVSGVEERHWLQLQAGDGIGGKECVCRCVGDNLKDNTRATPPLAWSAGLVQKMVPFVSVCNKGSGSGRQSRSRGE